MPTRMATEAGTLLTRAYTRAAAASTTHPVATIARKRHGGFSFAIVIACGALLTLQAAEGPANLAKRVAARESATAEERSHYTYTQSVRLEELDARGSRTGDYAETREVIFSPEGERSERFLKDPVSNLKNLVMTPEDFADVRNVQPFVLTLETLWNYDADYKGEEPIDGIDCYVLRIRPKRLLSGQRLFDGLIWARQDDFSVVQSEGQAVPQIITAKQENLFPRFRTKRKPVNGFWFPAITSADDTLFFRGGPIREKLVIRYNDYKRFGSDATIRFEQ